jgi:hypothetical protein
MNSTAISVLTRTGCLATFLASILIGVSYPAAAQAKRSNGDANCVQYAALQKWYSGLEKSDQLVPSDIFLAAIQRLGNETCSLPIGKKLIVVDFGRHSSVQRLWLLDLGNKLGFNNPIHVSHGRGSDSDNDGFAERFSDRTNSKMSSLGLYRGAERYTGIHGASLRLDGLDDTNGSARDRFIVVHSTERARRNGRANYVSADWLAGNGKLGRSWGCFVVMFKDLEQVMSGLSEGGYLFAARTQN